MRLGEFLDKHHLPHVIQLIPHNEIVKMKETISLQNLPASTVLSDPGCHSAVFCNHIFDFENVFKEALGTRLDL